MTGVNRAGLASYVAAIAAYEASIAAAYGYMRVGPSLLWDPRLPINWVFAPALERFPHPLEAVLLLSCAWHFAAAWAILKSWRMVKVFGIAELILCTPGFLMYGAVLLGLTGHVLTLGNGGYGIIVFAACCVVPVIFSFLVQRPREPLDHHEADSA